MLQLNWNYQAENLDNIYYKKGRKLQTSVFKKLKKKKRNYKLNIVIQCGTYTKQREKHIDVSINCKNGK